MKKIECTGWALHFYDAGKGQSGSDKFYTAFMYLEPPGTYRVVMNWGRDGARGQVKVQVFSDRDDARRLLDKKLSEEIHKGYEKLGEGTVGLTIGGDSAMAVSVAGAFKTLVAERPADKSRMTGGFLIKEEPG